MYSQEEELYFQETPRGEKMSNRVASRAEEKVDKSSKSKDKPLADSRLTKLSKSSMLIDSNLLKLDEVLREMDHISTKPRPTAVSREEIHPQVESDDRVVMLNNKRVKF
jgi:hypothetical protein